MHIGSTLKLHLSKLSKMRQESVSFYGVLYLSLFLQYDFCIMSVNSYRALHLCKNHRLQLQNYVISVLFQNCKKICIVMQFISFKASNYNSQFSEYVVFIIKMFERKL